MKALRYALYALAGALAVAGAVAGYVAATFDPNAYKSDLAALVKDKTGRTLTIDGDIGLTFFPRIGVRLGRTALSEVRGGAEFAAVERVGVALALLPLLSREVVVDEVVVEGLRATVVRRKDGSTNLDDLLGGGEQPVQSPPAPAAEAPARPIRLDVQGVRIAEAALTFRDEQAGTQYAVSDLTLETGRISPGVPAEFRLAARLQASTPPVDVNLRLQGSLDADLEKQTLALSGIAGKFEIRSPAVPVQPLQVTVSGKANADLKKQAAEADLALKADQSSIQAVVGLDDFVRPRLRFDAAVDRLDLDRYRSAAPQTPGKKPAAAGGGDDAPVDLSALKALNLAGRLRVDELVAARVKASNVRIDVKAQGGRLQIDPLVADLYQGRVRGAIGVDADGNRFSVKQSLSGVAIGPLLEDALAQDLLAGRGDIALDLTAAGASVGALKRSLSGGASLKLSDGAIKGINLAQSLRNAKSALSLNKDSETAAAPGEKTDFSELAASFSIENGKARNEDLSVKSPFLRLNGAGEVDIVQGGLDYLAKVTVVASPGGQGGKELADLAGLTVPVRVSGPLTAPKFKLELSSALAGAAKSQVEQKKEALKSKLESRLQEKLLGDQPAQPPAQGEATGAGPAAPEPQPLKPEDELKKKLRGLLR